MKKKQIILLAIQLVLMMVAGILLYSDTQNKIQPTTVYVFNKDIPVNTEITEKDLTKILIPANAVTNEFALELKDQKDENGKVVEKGIVGLYTSTQVFKNQYVIKNLLVEKDNVDPFLSMDLTKLRKMSLPISYETGFGGNVKRGDKIDLVFTGEGTKKNPDGSEKSFLYSKTFVQGAYVYNVVTEDGFKFEDHSNKTITSTIKDSEAQGEQISTESSSDSIAVITIAVTVEQAEEIATRLEAGSIKVVGRFDESKSYETLGYILGDYEKILSGNMDAETGSIILNEESTDKE